MRNKKIERIAAAVFLMVSFFVFNSKGQDKKAAKPLHLGYSVSIENITPEKMSYAKSVGIDYIEVSPTGLIGKERNFKLTDEEITGRMKKIREVTEAAGIKIWSVHMPFGRNIDLSLSNETDRQ
ncbi:MAG: hypothetical protein AB2L20_01080 [Mangrovibacterium sp.]